MAQNNLRRLALFALTLFVVIGLAACRLKTPTTTEQSYLIEKGAFPAGVPPWVARTAVSGTGVKRSGGLIPESFSLPPAIQNTNVPPETVTEDPEEQRIAAAKQEAAKKQELAPEPKNVSPLDRINALCPGIEPDVTRAISTAEARPRSQKLSALVNRCPKSADLWLWLGQSYSVQRKGAEAKHAFERARSLDPQNPEIKRELEKLDSPGKK